MVISTSIPHKHLITRTPISSGHYNAVIIGYPLQYDIIYILILQSRTFALLSQTHQVVFLNTARIMVIASGDMSDVSRNLKIGILTPNKMFADNIKMCPFILSVYQTL